MRFYLGVHRPHWLESLDVPLFLSRRVLQGYKTLPRARMPWALDSGGFTELRKFGGWRLTAKEYVAEVRRYRDEIGNLDWAAPLDWMCEPDRIAATGLTVEKHQQLTLENYLELKSLAPELPFIPVIQGWSIYSYTEHLEAYYRRNIRLADAPCVGVGSVCGRKNEVTAALILQSVADENYNVHGFGVKSDALELVAPHIRSADSMAWSFNALKSPPLHEHAHLHKHCVNCQEWAADWRMQMLANVTRANPGLQLE